MRKRKFEHSVENNNPQLKKKARPFYQPILDFFQSMKPFSGFLDEQKEQEISPYEMLPDEVKLHIFSFLDPLSLLAISSVNKNSHCIASDEKLWAHVSQQIFPEFYRHFSSVKCFKDFSTNLEMLGHSVKQSRILAAIAGNMNEFANLKKMKNNDLMSDERGQALLMAVKRKDIQSVDKLLDIYGPEIPLYWIEVADQENDKNFNYYGCEDNIVIFSISNRIASWYNAFSNPKLKHK